MASDFVRNIKDVRNIDILSRNTVTENDLISTRDGEVYVVTKKGYRKITNIETKDFEALKKQADTNTLNISDLTDDIDTLNTTTETNTSDIESLKTSTGNNTSKIETLKTSTDNNTSEIETLKTDTSNWQKYKLTEDDGSFTSLDVGTDMLTLKAGNYESSGFVNDPLDDNGFYEVTVTESYNERKVIHAVHSYSNRYFIKTIHSNGADKGWKELTDNNTSEIEQLQKQIDDLKANTKQYYTLFEGSEQGVGSTIQLNDDFHNYYMIFISGEFPGGVFTEPILVKALLNDIAIQRINLRDSDGTFLGAYEVKLTPQPNNILEITNDVSWDEMGSTGSGMDRNAYHITNIEGVK